MNFAQCNHVLEDTRRREVEDSQAFDTQNRFFIQESQQQKQRFVDSTMLCLHAATHHDYMQYLQQYICAGRVPTHSYDYPFSRVVGSWYVATQHFYLPALYGSSSVQIIVPEGIVMQNSGHAIGHSSIYYLSTGQCCGWWVPIYSDMKFGAGL